MRRLAILLVSVALVVIADVTLTCGDRVRDAARRRFDTQLGHAVEDWQMAVWMSVLLAASATGWVLALDPWRSGRLARVGRSWARGGVAGAGIGGLAAGIGLTAVLTALATDRPPLDRYEFEVRLVGGAWAGAIVGMAIGGGLGAVRLSAPRG